MICWFFLVPAGVPVLVSLLLFSFLRKGVLFHHDLLVPPGSGWGSGACLPFFSLLWFRCLYPFFCLLSFLRKGVLFHDDLLVPLGAGWLSPFFSPPWFRSSALSPFFSRLSFLRKGVLFHHDLLAPPGSDWGFGACLPSSLFFLSSRKGFCSMMICWFLLVLAGVPVLVSLLLSSLVPVLVSLLLCSFLGFCSIMIFWFFLVPAGVPVLVSLLLSSFFPQERGSVPS